MVQLANGRQIEVGMPVGGVRGDCDRCGVLAVSTDQDLGIGAAIGSARR